MGGSWICGINHSVLNDRHDALDVLEHIVVPEAKHAIAARIQKYGPSAIGDHSDTSGVSTAVNLDNQPARMTAKINKIATDRGLSSKMRAFDSRFPQMPPEFSLGVRHRTAQSAGVRHPNVYLTSPARPDRHVPHP